MKQRYKYIFHTELPNELDIEPDELSSEYVALKFKWDKSCPRYKSNPNHHFHIKRGMIRDDRILEICEVMDYWFPTTPSKFYVIREIHKKGNHKFVDMAELYSCKNCEVYSRSQNSFQLPYKIWKRMEHNIFTGHQISC